MNQIFIAGNLGSDPEVRFTSSGQKVTSLRVAAKSRKAKTIWWRVTVWGEQFDKMIVHLKKGSGVMVFGELSDPEIYTDKEGKPQISLNITATNLLFNPFGRAEGTGASSTGGFASSGDAELVHAAHADTLSGQGKGDLTFSDDDMPF